MCYIERHNSVRSRRRAVLITIKWLAYRTRFGIIAWQWHTSHWSVTLGNFYRTHNVAVDSQSRQSLWAPSPEYRSLQVEDILKYIVFKHINFVHGRLKICRVSKWIYPMRVATQTRA